MTAVTQDEIVQKTKTVLQGLEALRSEHTSILQSLEPLRNAPDDTPVNPLMQEKAALLQKSLDMIKLGLGEAQVRFTLVFCLNKRITAVPCTDYRYEFLFLPLSQAHERQLSNKAR
jgi:kinesin light chain